MIQYYLEIIRMPKLSSVVMALSATADRMWVCDGVIRQTAAAAASPEWSPAFMRAWPSSKCDKRWQELTWRHYHKHMIWVQHNAQYVYLIETCHGFIFFFFTFKQCLSAQSDTSVKSYHKITCVNVKVSLKEYYLSKSHKIADIFLYLSIKSEFLT